MGGASPSSRLGSICWAASLAAGPAPSQCPGPPPPPSAARWKYQPACSQKWERKPVSGRDRALRCTPGVLLGAAQGNLVTRSWVEARTGACGELQTLAGCLHTRSITKPSLSFLIGEMEPSLSSGQSSGHRRVCPSSWSQGRRTQTFTTVLDPREGWLWWFEWDWPP